MPAGLPMAETMTLSRTGMADICRRVGPCAARVRRRGYWPCDNSTVRKDDAAALGLQLGGGAHLGRTAASACGDGADGRYSSTGPTREHHRTNGAGPQRSVSDDAKTNTAPVLVDHDRQREPS